MSQRELRLGIVGCGGIAYGQHGPAAEASRQVKFVACCDIREEKARRFAEAYACGAIYTDYEEMVRKEGPDGVLLATWPIQHREQIEKCLAAGARNILCEKALAMRGREALQIWEMLTAADAFLMEGFMYRHHPAVRMLERILSHGELGPVDSVRAVFTAYDPETASPADPNRNWRQRRECGGGIPYDFACYPINACNHFAGGPPARVFCTGSVSEKYGTMNRFYGIIEYENGCVGIVESSKKSDFSQELGISCAQGILNLPTAWTIYGKTAIIERRSSGWAKVDTKTHAIERANAYQLQLENFAAVIRLEAQPVMPLVESVANTFVLEALVTSLQEERIVEVEIPDAVRQAIRK